MNIDFPLILVLLVSTSGFIWLCDSLFFSRVRKNKNQAKLRKNYPYWETETSQDAIAFKAESLKKLREPVLVEYAKSFFPVLFFVFVLRSFLVEPFQIPSSSMVPTLQVGDYILVNKYTYGIRLPVIRTQVLPLNKPERGDVMVFFPPHMEKTYFIKRVIGLPGDTVVYSNKQLTINGEIANQELLAALPPLQPRFHLVEENLGGVVHKSKTDLYRPRDDFAIRVQPGHYFMMGDNRDNSADSRVWGQVPERNIVGKAFAIWMQWDSFFSLPSFSRVGAINP
tara:strand:- start:2113 stop:2958 length:846 start_codon:yes stop_codon:yes gene_type:complete